MSRRKQARPRLCKRDDEDDGDVLTNCTEDADPRSEGTDAPSKESGYSLVDVGQPDLDTTGPAAKIVKFDSDETSDLRCDTCGAIFRNLTQFMDHRNFECSPGSECQPQWTIENLATNIGHLDSLSSGESGDEAQGLELPLSPGLENLTPEDVPGVVGVSQANPYGCHFCDKAFPRLSFLKIHEQIHSDQLPFKCSICSRRFRHKRSRDRHVKLHTGEKKYKCRQCQAAFVRSDHLKSHMKTHDSSKVSFQCEICQQTFTSLDVMMNHMTTHDQLTDPSKSLRCIYCPQEFTNLSDYKFHLMSHDKVQNQSFLCSLCGSVFPTQDDLDNHVEKVHLDETRNKCPLCSEVFGNLYDLYAHMSSHESDLKEQGACQVKTLTGASIHGELLVCPYCFCSDFDTLEVLEIHMQSVHSVKPAEVYTCNYCNAPYKNLYSLHEHMRAVHQNQPCLDIKYPCSLCSRQFGSIETLIQHKRALHPNEHRKSKAELLKHAMLDHRRLEQEKQKKIHAQTNLKIPTPRKSSFTKSSFRGCEQNKKEITCEQCNARFYDFLHFQNHMKLHMEAKVPLKLQEALSPPALSSGLSPVSVSSSLSPGISGLPCKHCSLQFPNEELLEKHIVSHYLNVSTEYGCTTCVKLFSKPDELQKHLMDIHAHHLYRCALCKEIFDSKVNIQVHFAIKHSNECKLYRCTKCDSVFRSEVEWSVHVRVNHLQIAKPYRCLFCKDSFSSEMELQCHLTTHSRPFKCSMCSESFHVEYLLDKHVQNVHSTEEGTGRQTPSHHVSDRATPKTQHPPSVKVKVEKDLMDLSFGGNKDPNADGVNFFSPRASPGIWKSSDLTFTCNICDMKFSHHPALLSHKAHDHGLSAILKAVGGEHHSDTKPQAPLDNHQDKEKVPSPDPSFSKDKGSVSAAETPPPKSLPMFMSPERVTMSCLYCSQTFKNRTEMDKHMKIHLNNGDEKCNICDRVFSTPSILAEHKLTHCKIKEGNVCVLCKVALKSEEQFYIHTQEHGFQSTYIQCLICRQTLVSMVELQMHGKHHFQSTNSSFTCCVCLEAFKSKESLVSKINASGRNYFVCKMCYHGSKSLCHCETCGDSFLNPLQLEAHVFTHHGGKQEHTCHKCQATFQSSLLLKAHTLSHHSSEPTPDLSCDQCPASFSSNSQLEAHQQTHRKSYTCIKCQESFDSEEDIQQHVASHVRKEGNIHECKLCSLSFTSPAKLQCHLIEHTYQNSEFRCSICCRLFTNAADIQQHAVEHGLGARRYSCSNCSQKFFFSAELENHQLCDHDGLDNIKTKKQSLMNGKEFKVKQEDLHIEKLSYNTKQNGNSSEIQCPVCAQTFHKVTEIITHIQEHCEAMANEKSSIHQGEALCCPVCRYTSPNLLDLKNHLKTEHTDIKLSCSICKKTFSHPKTLKLHVRLHNSSKGYECPVCHKRFTRKENRKAHMKTHKGIKSTLYQCLTDTTPSKNSMENLNGGNKMAESVSKAGLLAVNGAE